MNDFLKGNNMTTTTSSFFQYGAAALLLACTAMDASAMTTATFRADVREIAPLATGVEGLGSADGTSVTAWDTTQLADGWTTLTIGGVSTNVLVLNGPSVVGGRM